MGDREEWSFQWPDGTWIHWNPRTQSWEKETEGGTGRPSAAPSVAEPEPEPEREPAHDEIPETEQVAEDEPEPVASVEIEEEVVPDLEPVDAIEDVLDDEEAAEVVAEEGPAEAATDASSRAPRSMVGNVLPPLEEAGRPGGSLWPTILAGAALGVGVGLLLWSLIR